MGLGWSLATVVDCVGLEGGLYPGWYVHLLPKMVNKINAIEYSGGTGLHHRYTRAGAWIMCINAGNRTDDLGFKRDRIKAAWNAALIL
jgi:hypothetical protein